MRSNAAAQRYMILSIDPGLSLTGGTGYALFSPSLIGCGLVTPREERLEDRIAEIHLELQRRCAPYGERSEVVIEKMKVYAFAKQKGSQGDIIDLAHLGGCLMELARRATLVEPSTWKGQVPKDVVKGLVEHRLTPAELETLDAGLASVSAGKRHNVYDAVGIGLWHLKRWPK